LELQTEAGGLVILCAWADEPETNTKTVSPEWGIIKTRSFYFGGYYCPCWWPLFLVLLLKDFLRGVGTVLT
jgi:hypothetical protein